MTWYNPLSWFNNGPAPSPINFANGSPVPKGNPASGSGSPLPVATPGTGGSQFSSAQQSQLQSALSASGIWDTISGLGGDIWDTIAFFLPHNSDGSVDWGKLGGDIAGWVSKNKNTILQGLSAYNAYQRQNKADQLGQQAVDLAKQGYDAKAPLRAAGMAGMLNPGANTPNLSALGAQGQQGGAMQAPLPVASPKGNLQNAQSIAGPNSGNPFGRSTPAPLPVASPPMPTGPSMPSGPRTPTMPAPFGANNTPGNPGTPGSTTGTYAPTSWPGAPGAPPFTPTPPTNGPPPGMIGMAPQLPTVPGQPQTPARPLPISFAPQSGRIANGPQARTLPQFPALPVAGY